MLKGPPVFVARTFYGEVAPRFAHPFAVPRPDSCPMVSPKPPKYDRANRWHDEEGHRRDHETQLFQMACRSQHDDFS